MEGYKFVNKCGIEIEGCWKEIRTDLVPDASLHDGTHFETPFALHPVSGQKVALFGELVSPPLSKIEDIYKLIDENWPDYLHSQCGFHIHISLNSVGLYCHCMSRKFYDNFLSAACSWGEKFCPKDRLFWDRLNDKNRYCRKRFIPDAQVVCKSKDDARDRQVRATHFNYCFGQHKTIECRLFPMWQNKDIAKEAVVFLINFFENYLSEITNPDAPLIVPDEMFLEEPLEKPEITQVILKEDDNIVGELDRIKFKPLKQQLEKMLFRAKKKKFVIPSYNFFCEKRKNKKIIKNAVEFSY